MPPFVGQRTGNARSEALVICLVPRAVASIVPGTEALRSRLLGRAQNAARAAARPPKLASSPRPASSYANTRRRYQSTSRRVIYDVIDSTTISEIGEKATW